MRHENPANRFARQKLESRNKFPAANGTSSLGPGHALRFANDYQTVFCVRVELIAGDPNSNGGRDSNGYYRCFLENDRWGPTNSAPVEMRLNPDDPFAFAAGQRWGCYAYDRTSGSPTSTDDGFMLLRPIGAQVPNAYMNVSIPFHGTADGDCTAGDLEWNIATDLRGFKTTDSISFTIPDDSAYVATFSAPVHIGSGSPGLTYPAFDSIDVQIALSIDGMEVASGGTAVGWIVSWNDNISDWSYLQLGSRTVAFSYVFSGKAGKDLKYSLVLHPSDGIVGGGSGDFTAIQFFAGPNGAPKYDGNLTVVPIGIAAV